jgi:hypothetical protein
MQLDLAVELMIRRRVHLARQETAVILAQRVCDRGDLALDRIEVLVRIRIMQSQRPVFEYGKGRDDVVQEFGALFDGLCVVELAALRVLRPASARSVGPFRTDSPPCLAAA